MRAAAMPVIAKHAQDHHGRAYEFFQTDSDVVSERTPSISPPPRSQSGFKTGDMLKYCMIGTAAVVINVAIALLLRWVWMRRQRRKEAISAASAEQLETVCCPSPPQTRTSRPGTPDSGDECQQLLPPWSPPPSRSPSPSPAVPMPQDPPSTPPPQCPASPSPSDTAFCIPPSTTEPQPTQPLSTLVEASSKSTRRPIKTKWHLYRHRTFHHQSRGTELSPRLKRDRVLS